MLAVTPLGCISITNQECKVRPEIVIVNYDEAAVLKQVNLVVVATMTMSWNDDKCRCECKELIDKGVFDKRFIWNPSNCECECDKSCYIGAYLDYKSCECKKRLVNKLIEHSSAEECTENTDETRLVEINSTECKHNFCAIYIVLFAIIFTVNIGISSYFLCFYWYLKRCYSC